MNISDKFGRPNPAGVTKAQRALLDPTQLAALDALAAAIEHEQKTAEKARGVPDAIHKARLRVNAAQREWNRLRPPLNQADLVRQQIRQDRIDRGLPIPERLA